MSELMNLSPRPESIPISPTMPNALSLQSKLIKADFHGSIVTGKSRTVELAYIALTPSSQRLQEYVESRMLRNSCT